MPRGNGQIRKKPRAKTAVTFCVPIVALSTNKLYTKTRHHTSAYKKYRRVLFQFLEDNYSNTFYKFDNKSLALDVEVGFSSPLADLSNSIKGLEDVAAEHFGFNDRMVIDISMRKYLVDKGDEYVKLTIKCTRRQHDQRKQSRRNYRGCA